MYCCLNDDYWIKKPITLSFFFKEVANFRFLLPYQSFEQLVIVDAQPLLTMAKDAIVDPLFELIGARTTATEERLRALTSNYFRSHQVWEKKWWQRSLFHASVDFCCIIETKTASKQRQAARTTIQRMQVCNKNVKCPVLKVTQKDFVKNLCRPGRWWSLMEFDGNKIATKRGRVIAIDCCCFFFNFPCRQVSSPM